MDENKQPKNQVKVTLRDKDGNVVKTVVMNKLTNKMTDQALEIATTKVKDGNQFRLIREGEKELMKLLLVSINGEVLTGLQKEQYMDLFDGREIDSITLVIEEMRGKPLTPEIEFI